MPDLNPNSGKSPISKSLDEIINIVKNSHQGESPNYKDIDTRVKTLEESMISISTLCLNISLKLDLVINNSSTNSSSISAVEHRVDELDHNTKVYVDSKVKSIINQTSKSSTEINTPPEAFNGSVETLKKEIKSLKRKQLSDEQAISLIS